MIESEKSGIGGRRMPAPRPVTTATPGSPGTTEPPEPYVFRAPHAAAIALLTGSAGNIATQGGALFINNNSTPANSTDDFIDYTPPAGFFGEDVFYYEICDQSTPAECDVAEVVVTITPPIDVSLTKTVAAENANERITV